LPGGIASGEERFDRDFETGFPAVGIFAVQDIWYLYLVWKRMYLRPAPDLMRANDF
jgi:hypothetical protein